MTYFVLSSFLVLIAFRANGFDDDALAIGYVLGLVHGLIGMLEVILRRKL